MDAFRINRFPHGKCEIGNACEEPAVFRLQAGKSCVKHKPESVVFAPFLGQQEKFFQRRERVVFFGGAAGPGKLMPLNTPVPTPTGWSTMGELSPGDFVIGIDGRPVMVVGESPVEYAEDAYRFTFSDGTSIVSGERHLWKTLTDKERTKLLHRDPAWREKRKRGRASRATGRNKRPHVAAVNAARVHAYLPRPTGTVRTTKEIVDTLTVKHGAAARVNHSIDNHLPLNLPSIELPAPPYTLGAWLGDGSTGSGGVTSADDEIVQAIERDGFEVRKVRAKYLYYAQGLQTRLRAAGVLSDKRIPSAYLRASHEQRLALLRGLMDTDGWVDRDGYCLISLCKRDLFNDVVELIRTFGIIVHVRSSMKTATNGRAGNSTEAWSAQFVTDVPVFSLTRKAAKQKTAIQARYRRRYITAAENLGPLPMKCIQIANDDGMYLAGHQMVPTHNSLCLLMKFGQQLAVEKQRHAFMRKRGKNHKSTAWGLYLRRTTPNLKQAKTWSRNYMPAFDPAARFVEDEGIWTFPSAGGATFQFGHMEHERDKYRFKSSQYTYIAFDELTEFSETQYEYLDTRLRTTDEEIEPLLQMVSASNPDGEGLAWVREKFIEVAPPETVVRIETKLGDGRIHAYDQIFIPAKLTDNPVLLASGSYEASLRNKRPEVREALLNGNWYVSVGAYFGSIWNSDTHVVEDHDIPEGAKVFRSGDWGIKSPSSIGWWYEDSEGCLTCFAHLRTVGLNTDKVALEVKRIEMLWGFWNENLDESRLNYARNPLDSACFANHGFAGAPTIAKDFARMGVRWKPAKKGPGSRYNGLAQMVRRFTTIIPAAFEGATSPTERARPMLRFMANCKSPIKTIPTLNADPSDPNDVDTKGDDHDTDMTIYTCLENPIANQDDPDEMEDEDERLIPPQRSYDRLLLGEPIR